MIFSNMLGVKVMIKEVLSPPLVAVAAGDLSGYATPTEAQQVEGEPLPLFAIVCIDNCEAKTSPEAPAFGASLEATVVWNQKMAFPVACAANAVMHVHIFSQPIHCSPIPVAEQAIKIEDLPWNAEGQVPLVVVNLEDLTGGVAASESLKAKGLIKWRLPNGGVGKGNQTIALHIQAWVLNYKPVPNTNDAAPALPPSTKAPKGKGARVRCVTDFFYLEIFWRRRSGKTYI
jgi:hypothetical protein